MLLLRGCCRSAAALASRAVAAASTRAVHTDTIFGLSSGAGKAGVAVVRVSGPHAQEVLSALAPSLPRHGAHGIGASLASRTLHRVSLAHPRTRERLDEAMAVLFRTPRSYTGEDVVEFHLHGSPAVVAAVLGAIGSVRGTRLADRGEFSRRAWEAGKMTLTRAEGLADLLDARTDAQRRFALAQLSGTNESQYDRWADDARELLAHAEALLDFGEDEDLAGDVASDTGAGSGSERDAGGVFAAMRVRLAALESATRTHLGADRGRADAMRTGLRLVVAGAPNAGKSSLVNALAGRSVAIVSPRAGTTRDTLDVALDMGGFPVTVTDTAGVRVDLADDVEAEGVIRAQARWAAANLPLLAIDATCARATLAAPAVRALVAQAASRGPSAALVVAVTKVDLVPESQRDALLATTRTLIGTAAADVVPVTTSSVAPGLALLERALTARARAFFGSDDGAELPYVAHARHAALLAAAVESLSRASAVAASASGPKRLELIAEDLRNALANLGRISGRVDPERVLDAVFSRFCIGK